MEVQFTPDLQAKLDRLANASGRSQQEFVQEAMVGYLDNLGSTREMLDSRYDDIKSGKVQLIDGEHFFEDLRRREAELLAKPSPR